MPIIENSARYEKQNNINIWILEDLIQEIITDTCGAFQIYFYEDLFFPDYDSKIREYKTLTK